MRALVPCGILLVGVATSVVVAVWVRSEPPAPPPFVGDVSGGVPIQRGRIDDFIERISKESYAETVANLNFHEDYVLRTDQLHYPGHSDTYLTEICLANRRLARIYEHLMKLSESERGREAMMLFDKSIADFRDKANLILTRWEEGNPPKDPQELFGKDRSLKGYRWALAGSQFLCVVGCSLKDCISCYDRMNTLRDELKARVEADPKRLSGPYIEIDYLLTPSRFEVNLARIVFTRFFDVADMDAFMPTDMEATETPFFAWNAHTNQQDFTHQRRGVPTDDSRILTTFSLYAKWHRMGGDRAERDKVIDRCWVSVIEHAGA